MSTNPTFGDWEQTVLEHCYPCLDYISLHQYYGGQEKGTAEFLAQSLDMERYIETVLNICDYVRVKKKMSHKINICFDEWGVWSMSDVQVQKSGRMHRGRRHPRSASRSIPWRMRFCLQVC